MCRQVLADNPLSGAIFVFRNRAGTALKLLCYDGQGLWLCTKRLSQGHFTWWPQRQDASYGLCARELLVLGPNPTLTLLANSEKCPLGTQRGTLAVS